MLLHKKFSSAWFDFKNLARTVTAVGLFPASLVAGLTYIQSEFAQLTAAESRHEPVVVRKSLENQAFSETDMATRHRGTDDFMIEF